MSDPKNTRQFDDESGPQHPDDRQRHTREFEDEPAPSHPDDRRMHTREFEDEPAPSHPDDRQMHTREFEDEPAPSHPDDRQMHTREFEDEPAPSHPDDRQRHTREFEEQTEVPDSATLVPEGLMGTRELDDDPAPPATQEPKGTRQFDDDTKSTRELDDDPQGTREFPQTPSPQDTREAMQVGLPGRIRFLIREGGGVLEVPTYHSLIVGRKNSTQPVDVDLSDFQATELGISRQHIQIQPKPREGRLVVKDLNSINGSFLNRRRMLPGHYYDLHHGDALKLGLMHIRIEFVD